MNMSQRWIAFLPAWALLSILAVCLLFCKPGATRLGADENSDLLTSRPAPKAQVPAVSKIGDEIRTGAGERRRVRLEEGVDVFVNQETSVQHPARDVLKLSSGEVFIRIPNRKQQTDFVFLTPDRRVKAGLGDFRVRHNARGTNLLVTRGVAKVAAAGEEINVAAGQTLTTDGTRPSAATRVSHALDWMRELLAADSPLVPGSRHAGGALLAVDPDGQEAKITLRKFHIDVHIEDGFARTTIDQTYFNHEPVQLEGTFYFPLPADASLSRLAMYVNGQLMEGGMVERNYGRQVYDTIRYQNYDPALLEWLDGTTFKMRVFPLGGEDREAHHPQLLAKASRPSGADAVSLPGRAQLADGGQVVLRSPCQGWRRPDMDKPVASCQVSRWNTRPDRRRRSRSENIYQECPHRPRPGRQSD